MADVITQLLLRIWDLIFYAVGVGIGTGIGVPIGNKIIKMFDRHQDLILDQAKRLVVNGDKRQEIQYDTPRSFPIELKK